MAVEPIPHARSVTIAVWLGVGSHYESAREAGTAHFLEHMLFKGTTRHSGRELADRMDRIGGEFNAVTSREATCYYGWVLAEFWREAVGILAEIIRESRLDPDDVERERTVILEEIRGEEGTAEVRAMNAFDRVLWGRHPLGRPVAGSLRTVSRLSAADLHRLYADQYTPDNAVVAMAGQIDPDAAAATVGEEFSGWSGTRGRGLPRRPQAMSARVVQRRRGDQVHLLFGGPGPALGEPDFYAATLLSTVLGGGASSRLFQRIREEEGLAYTVYAFHEAFRVGGTFGVHAAVHPEQATRAARLIREELRRVVETPLPAAEMDRARVQVRSGLLLGLESIPEQANRIGESLVLLGRVLPLAETLTRLEQVTAGQVQDLARRLWGDGSPVELVFGPVGDTVLAP